MKQSLTTIQITQFVVGAGFAFAHLFVAYQIPIDVPYVFRIKEVVQNAATAIKSDASSALSVATATASADLGSWLKKLALRAAGREGLAENVENQYGHTFGIDAYHAAEDYIYREEVRHRNDHQWVHCLDTSGQTFAIYLNIFYLAPLTWLFLRFFIKSYLERTDERRRSLAHSRASIASQSLADARKGVSRRLSEAFEDYQGANGDLNEDGVVVDGAEVRRELQEMAKNASNKVKSASQSVSEKASNIDTGKVKKQAQEAATKAKDSVQSGVQKAKEAVEQSPSANQLSTLR